MHLNGFTLEFANRLNLNPIYGRGTVLRSGLFYVLLWAAALTGCASNGEKPQGSDQAGIDGPYTNGNSDGPTVVSYTDYKDPLQPVNRVFFKFNDVLYRYMLSPLGSGYLKVTPDPVEKSVSNFFNNLREPLFSINHLLQGEFRQSGESLLRLGVNSTLGLLGLFDPADRWMNFERSKTTFGETLAIYGVGYGAYFVIPVLGPSTLRDGATMAFEYTTHPIHYVLESPDSTVYFVIEGATEMAPTLDKYPDLITDTEDPYIFIRNLYLQRLMRDDESRIKKVEDTEDDPGLYD